MKLRHSQRPTHAHHAWLRGVLAKANSAIKPLSLQLSASLPKTIPKGGSPFVKITVSLAIGKHKRPVVETFDLFAVVAEMEDENMRVVFSLAAVKQAVRIYSDVMQARATSLLNHFHGSREIVRQIAGE